MDLRDRRTRKEIGKNCACFNLRRAARLVTQRFERAFRGAGITANQFSILMASYNQAGILLTTMARNLGMERTTLSRNLSLLERRELVAAATGGDRRERSIAITKKGLAMLENTLPIWQEAQKGVVQDIGAGEWEALLAGLHRVAKGFQK